MDYEWQLDPDTNTCTLCSIGDKSCIYKKVVEIHAYCGAINDESGTGASDSLLNLQRTIFIDWNSIIVSELPFIRVLVAMNELGVREIEVIIKIADDQTCNLSGNIEISTTLLKFLPNL